MRQRRRRDQRIGRPWRRTSYPEAGDPPATPKIHESKPDRPEDDPTRTTTPVPAFTEPTRTAQEDA